MGRYQKQIRSMGLVPPEQDGLRLLGTSPYAQRMQAALTQISRPDYPDGMIAWLETGCSDLYRKLTNLSEGYPAQIDRLWREQAPLDKFQGALDRWLEAHQQVCNLYRSHLAAQDMRDGQRRMAAQA